MKNLRHTGRFIFHLTALAYVCLYLLSPFFHHHFDTDHEDVESSLHSHVLGEIAGHDRDADSHYTLDQVDDHDLAADVEVVVIGLSPRTTGSPCEAELACTITDFRTPLLSEEREYVGEPRLGGHRGREYILSASNVSPPLV